MAVVGLEVVDSEAVDLVVVSWKVVDLGDCRLEGSWLNDGWL